MKPCRNYKTRRITYLFTQILNYCPALRPSKSHVRINYGHLFQPVDCIPLPYLYSRRSFYKSSNHLHLGLPFFYFPQVSSQMLSQGSFLDPFSLLWGADKSLARHISRCRRAESIVSLERGVCSCAELQVFPCCRDRKEACQSTPAISTTSRSELSGILFFCKAKRRRKFTPFGKSIRVTITIVCHRQKMGGPV